MVSEAVHGFLGHGPALQHLGSRSVATGITVTPAEPPVLAKTNKRGFPEVDPRTKGGTENDVGLQVGPAMWRWPSNWPYPEGFHDVKANDTGAVEWWDANGKSLSTGPYVDDVAMKALEAHVFRHVPQDAEVLDLGAGAQSALPQDFKVKDPDRKPPQRVGPSSPVPNPARSD